MGEDNGRKSAAERAKAGADAMRNSTNAPKLGAKERGTRTLEAWFLGPKAENYHLLKRLVDRALRDHRDWRRAYQRRDPRHITRKIRTSPGYREARTELETHFKDLLEFLKRSVPFFSMRYQGHMIWEVTLPGLLGYFAALLHNPNNVAFEASPATTVLEMLVTDDLCRLLGFYVPEEGGDAEGEVRAWGHITADGSIANIEALWAARNLKLLPLALREALRKEQALAGARRIRVPLTTGGERELEELNDWQLLNLRADDVLALTGRFTREYCIASEAVTIALEGHSVQNLGIREFSERLGGSTRGPVLFAPGSRHYSMPKAAALLGLGSDNLINVSVDEDGRMSMPCLRKHLQRCLSAQTPVLAVVVVLGSTEESAVDPLAEVLDLRDELREKGLDFTVHVDAAWGGYHASLLRDDFDMPAAAAGARPVEQGPSLVLGLSEYVAQQYLALPEADSVTIDPHKSGYIPYPAGALCYRNSAMRDLVTFSAPVVYHGGGEPTVGIFGIEGSKPGAAAAAVYLSHRVIRPTKSGYGRIVGQALYSCKRLYARLLSVCGEKDPFILVPLPRLPTERTGGNVEAQKRWIREHIDTRTNDQIAKNPEAIELLAEIGPDLNILGYVFNVRHPDGTVSGDLELANRLNRAIYDRLSVKYGKAIDDYTLLISTTDLDEESYGKEFIRSVKMRLGVGGAAGTTITVLRSVVMDPWVTETSAFLDTFERELCKAARAALAEIAR